MKCITATTLSLLLLAAGATAAERPEKTVDPRGLTASFMTAHPDLDHRMKGQKAWEEGDFATAAREFREAAQWADKPSQAMLASLLWHGQGVAADRAEAYVWADLAAERGNRVLLIQRERFWAAMSEAEREHALQIGPALYDRFGDDIARPRLAKRIDRLAPRSSAASRLGYAGQVRVIRPEFCRGVGSLKVTTRHPPVGCDLIPGDDFYDRRAWDPDLYFAWQDRVADEAARGVVDVGALQSDD